MRLHIRAKKRSDGVRVRYIRGADQSEVIIAVAGSRTNSSEDPDDGFQMWTRERDLLFEAADLVLNGATIKPQQHDRIRRLDDDDLVLEEFGVGNPAYTESDPYGLIYRVHLIKAPMIA